MYEIHILREYGTSRKEVDILPNWFTIIGRRAGIDYINSIVWNRMQIGLIGLILLITTRISHKKRIAFLKKSLFLWGNHVVQKKTA